MLRRPLARVLAAEFVGAFALVFAGCGAVMVDAKRQALGHVGVALSFGLGIMVMIYAVGHISGGALQPGRHLRLRAQPPLPLARARTLAPRSRRARKGSRSCGNSC